MTQSLAVNRDNREFAVLFRILCKAVQPFEKAVLKCGRSDSGKEGANTIPTGRFPSGRSSQVSSHSFLFFAHRAIDFGPSAPAMMAASEMAIIFSTG